MNFREELKSKTAAVEKIVESPICRRRAVRSMRSWKP